MTPKALYSKFTTIFRYVSASVVSYKEINGDNHSIRIIMKNGTIYIFTYPSNGRYSLVVEKVGSYKEENE